MSDEAAGPTPVTAREVPGDELHEVTDEVLPALIACLRSSRLGELEVRTPSWRVRLRRGAVAPVARTTAGGSMADAGDVGSAFSGSVARSPAVGYFSPARDLAIGRSVGVGDLLGSIDVLGISQEVVAPSDGIVGRILAEDGQAVEYGQALADIDPLELSADEPAADER